MNMPSDLRALRLRITVLAVVLIALCAAGCLALLAAPLADADMATRRRLLEELSNQPIQAEAPQPDATRSAAIKGIVADSVPAWCRFVVDTQGAVVATETGGAWGSKDVSPGNLAALASLRANAGSSAFSFEGRMWVGVWQPVGAQDGAVRVSGDGSIESEEQGDGGRIYTFLDVSAHEEYVATLALRCVAAGAGITCAAAAIVAVATTRALRPVAEARNRERTFVLAASHDLKTPLMAIVGACDVLDAEMRAADGLRGVDTLAAGADAGMGTKSHGAVPPEDARHVAPGAANAGMVQSRWVSLIREAADEMAMSISEMLSRMHGGGGGTSASPRNRR